MPLNPYFLNGSSSEQRLIQDLVQEQIRMYGQEIVYMPRKFITEKKVIKELLVSKFDDGFQMEAYIANADGFGGQGDILSKFGVRSTDEITLIISKEKYEDYISPFILNSSDVKLGTRPQEGDLIYLPLDNSLFEIKYVEGKRPFYQLNNLYVYELKCELFEYEDELISTDIEEVDNTVKDFGYALSLQMVPSNSYSAELNVGVSTYSYIVENLPLPQIIGKSVSYVDIINGGYGYKSTPQVKIENAPDGGITATAVATLKVLNNQSTIDKILIVNPGIGYTIPPKIELISNSGSGFIGTCDIRENSLSPIYITNSGEGYSSNPIVSISTSPTGDNASAVSVINSSGEVSEIRYLNVGSGYTMSPTINIDTPIGLSTGNYIYNEMIEGQTSGTRAYVKDWNIINRELKVSIVNGNFALGEFVVGSAATYKIYSINVDENYETFASNQEIEEESDQILDFSETNPFGDF